VSAVVTSGSTIGQHWVTVTCSPALQRQAESLLVLAGQLHSEGPPLCDGTRLQFGWTIFTLREQENGTLAILEPDFDGNPFTTQRIDISYSLAIQVQMVQFALRVGVEPEDVTFQDKVVLAKHSLAEDRLYLVRGAHSEAHDSGWYCGRRDAPGDETELEALWVYQVLRQRPALAPVLALPVGYLVLVHGNTIEAVADPDDNEVWRA
jgi:hypothetical protein